jgi:hypothetical protein
MLLLFEAAFSTLRATSHLIAMERSQLRVAVRNNAMLPQNGGRPRSKTTKIGLFNHILTNRARHNLFVYSRAFLGNSGDLMRYRLRGVVDILWVSY